jgi:hypothetical protein
LEYFHKFLRYYRNNHQCKGIDGYLNIFWLGLSQGIQYNY